MKTFQIIVISTFLLLYCSFLSYSQVQWEYLGSHKGSNVSDVSIAPNGDIFAVSMANKPPNIFSYTVVRSTDNGSTWNIVKRFPNSIVGKIFIDSTGVIYIGDSSTLYRSTDNGSSWDTKSNMPGFFAIRESAGIIYASSINQCVYSTDRGSHWSPIPNATNIYLMDIDNNGSLYIVTLFQKFYKTTNLGTSWEQMQLPSINFIDQLYIANNNMIYIYTFNDTLPQSQIYVSKDGGNSWQACSSPFNTPGQYLPMSGFASFGDSCIYVGLTKEGVSKSTDYGESWQKIPALPSPTSPSVDTSIFCIATNDAGKIYVGTSHGLYIYDGSTTWIRTFEEMGEPEACVSMSPLSPNSFLVATPTYRFTCNRDGSGWLPLSAPYHNYEVQNYIAFGIDSMIFIPSSNKLMRSSDEGNSWDTVNIPANKHCFYNLFSNHKGWLYGTTVIDSSGYYYSRGIYRSTDNGNSWTSIDSVHAIESFAIDLNDALYIIRYPYQLDISTDDGNTWLTRTIPEYPIRLYISPNGHIYLPGTSNLYESSDKGATWVTTTLPDYVERITDIKWTKTGIMCITTEPRSSLTSNFEGFFISIDSGRTFSATTGNLGNTICYRMYIDVDDVVYLATSDGLYSSTMPFVIHPTPGLALDTTNLAFGSVLINQYGISGFTLTNQGSAPLILGTPTISGPDANDFSITKRCADTLLIGETDGFTIKLAPLTVGEKHASLDFTSNDSAHPVVRVNLYGKAVSPARIETNTLLLDFGLVQTGTSIVQDVVISNTGSAPTQIYRQTVDGSGFALEEAAYFWIPAGTSVTAKIRFSPSSVGTFSGTYQIYSDAQGQSTIDVRLSGAGYANSLALTLDKTTIDFGKTPMNTSVEQDLVVKNVSSSAIQINSESISGNDPAHFSIIQAISNSIPAGDSSMIRIRYTPTLPGGKSAIYGIQTSAGNYQVLLFGIAPSPFLVMKYSLSFGTIPVDSTSDRVLLLTNAGDADLRILSQEIQGSSKSMFTIIEASDTLIAPGDSSHARIRFAPYGTGSPTATYVVHTNIGGKAVALYGYIKLTTPRVYLSKTSITFPNTLLSSSSEEVFTIKNTGGGDLRIYNQFLEGSFPTEFSILQFADSLIPPNRTDTIRIRFSPTTGGHKSCYFKIQTNADSQRVFLNGSGVAPSPVVKLSKTSLGFVNVPVSTSTEEELTIRNTGNAGLQISGETLSGTDAAEFSIVQAANSLVPIGDSTVVRIRYSPLVAGSKSARYSFQTNSLGQSTIQVVLYSTLVNQENPPSADEIRLSQSYPNPVNAGQSASIDVTLPSQSYVSVCLYDMNGRKVAAFAEGEYGSGTHTFTFATASIPPGVYVYRMMAGTYIQNRMMIVQ